jgi:hypothetical protein
MRMGPWDVKQVTSGNLPKAIRYAAFIQKPVSGLVTAVIEVTCFIK